MGLANAFDTNIPEWKAWQTTPWGRLRYAIAQANLQRHLPGRPLRVLDAGGGNGRDSIALAAQGHAITIVDFSAEMLAEARASYAEHGCAKQLEVIHSDLGDLPSLFPAPLFDLVLCHNVLQYADDVPAWLPSIAHPLRPGGLISLISVNRYSETYRAAFQQSDLAEAHRLLGASSAFAPTFGVNVKRYAAEDLLPLLESSGLTLAGRYGIRCLSDYLQDERKADPAFFADLERLEYTLASTFPYYLLARFFQLIATKALEP